MRVRGYGLVGRVHHVVAQGVFLSSNAAAPSNETLQLSRFVEDLPESTGRSAGLVSRRRRHWSRH